VDVIFRNIGFCCMCVKCGRQSSWWDF